MQNSFDRTQHFCQSTKMQQFFFGLYFEKNIVKYLNKNKITVFLFKLLIKKLHTT